MLKELLMNTEFIKSCKEILKNGYVLDIVIFGSSIRGKERPNDLDLLVVYSNDFKDIIDENYKIKKILEKYIKNIQITGKKYKEIFEKSFLPRESILAEGFSISQNKFLSEGFGYKNFILFKYSLKNLSKSRRMTFYYSLYGRGDENGLLEKNNCIKFSDSIILSPISSSDLIKDFFESLKIEYINFPFLTTEDIK